MWPLKFSSRANLFFSLTLLVLRIFLNPPIIIITIIGQPGLANLFWAYKWEIFFQRPLFGGVVLGGAKRGSATFDMLILDRKEKKNSSTSYRLLLYMHPQYGTVPASR